MNTLMFYLAKTEEPADTGLFGALGVDWRMLLLQAVAFAVLVWFLSKFVYPHLLKAIDKREKQIAESVAAANEAEARAEQSQKEISLMLGEARAEADAIIATAKKEAASVVEASEEKAKKKAERIVADAHVEIEQDIAKARKALRDETADLIALATEKIVKEKIDPEKDAALIENAIKEAR